MWELWWSIWWLGGSEEVVGIFMWFNSLQISLTITTQELLMQTVSLGDLAAWRCPYNHKHGLFILHQIQRWWHTFQPWALASVPTRGTRTPLNISVRTRRLGNIGISAFDSKSSNRLKVCHLWFCNPTEH